MNRKPIAIAIAVFTLLALLLPVAYANVYQAKQDTVARHSGRVLVGAWIYVPAVSGSKGELVNLSVTLEWPGNGSIVVESEGIVGASTKYSIATAIWTAALLAGSNPEYFNAYIDIHATGEISGPSASLAAATLVLSMLTPFSNTSLMHHYVVTGAIVPQGFAGPVGGVSIKCRAAISKNLSFVLPVSNVGDLDPHCLRLNSSRTRILGVASIFDTARVVAGVPAPRMQSVNTTYPAYLSSAFRHAALYMINLTERLTGELSSKNTSSLVKYDMAKIYDLLNESEKTLRSAPYSSASYAFTALADAYALLYRQMLVENKLNLRSELENINNILNNLKIKINNLKSNIKCFERLETLSVAAARLSDSIFNLEVLNETLKSKVYNYTDLAYFLGMSRARIYSIESWLYAFNNTQCQTPLPANLISYLSMVSHFVMLNANYTISVLRELNMTSSADLLSQLAKRASKAWGEGDWILAFGYYREILSQCTSIMFTDLITYMRGGRGMLEEYWRAGAALYSYTSSMLSLHGVRSLLAPAYFEYAKNLLDTGDINSSIAILSDAIAANEVLLPLTLSSPPPANTSASLKALNAPSATREELNAHIVTALLVMLVIGFSAGFALAIRMLFKSTSRA
ncbi:MAG: hypothetical protein GSR80_001731 [Desulfurococcales archaeon]|nr:hypothetical protein [Desulfurococcales archaeon]